jgi:DNA-binding Lrp family transcriptional regulator|tara:strand:+ start:185 stop:703 length:519 start_codon:yes stop_codon:yes gene_type:complete
MNQSQLPLDVMDFNILRLLQGDATISNAELARQVKVSPSACWRRLQRMRKAGVIRRHVTLLAAERIGLAVTAFVDVTLEKRTELVDRQFRDAIRGCSEVLACFFVAGEADYMLRVVARDLPSLSEFLTQILMRLPGVSRIKTSVTLEEIKNTTELPLDKATDADDQTRANQG